jgi:hypothetical protein
MARRFHSNIAIDTTLVGGITSTDSALTVANSAGWPAYPFILCLEINTANEELILVGNKSGAVFSSLVRGFGGSAAVSHNNGATVVHVAVAEDFDEVYTHNHESGQGYTQINHDGLANIQTDDHHAQDHAARHAAGSVDQFLHAAEHQAGGGDQLLHRLAHGILGTDRSFHYQIFFNDGPMTIGYQTVNTLFATHTFTPPTEWLTYDLDVLGMITMFANPGTEVLAYNHILINDLDVNLWPWKVGTPSGADGTFAAPLYAGATGLAGNATVKWLGSINTTPPFLRVDAYQYLFLAMGRVRT